MGVKFKRDNTCHVAAIFNSMLNYGYTVLRSLVIRSIIKKGLDPRISLFHKSFSNFFALASDLMEPFRPVVDEIVYHHKNATIFSIKIKDELTKIFNHKVIIDGKRFFLNNAIDMMVDELVQRKK